MTDWPGFLKWSLRYNDNLKETEIPPLTDEQRKFLEEAFQATALQDVHRMKDILKELEEAVESENSQGLCIELLDELIEILTSPDMSKNFCKIGGPYFMIKYAMNEHLSNEVRGLALIVISDVAANNPYAHGFLCNVKFYELAQLIADNKISNVLKGRVISALNAIIKGNNLVTKRLFINKGGYEALVPLLQEQVQPYYIKLFRLFAELYSYEKYLDRDIEIIEDPNIKIKDIAACPDYAHLKRYFTKYSKNHSVIFLELSKQILSEDSVKNTELRSSFAHCIAVFYENLRSAKMIDFDVCHKTKKIVDEHTKKIQKNVAKNDVYESELKNLKKLQITMDI